MRHTKKCIGLLVAATIAVQAVLPGSVADAKKAAKPKLSTKSVKVKVGAKKTVKVKNAKGYKITVKSKNKKIATVSKKGKTAFVVKGVKKGNTKVTCTLKKGKKKVSLKCTVKVSKKNNVPTTAPTTIPTIDPTTAPTTEPVEKISPIGDYVGKVEIVKTNSNGNDVFEITSTGDANVGTFKLYIAGYDENGVLTSLKIKLSATSNRQTLVAESIDADEVKLMIWDMDNKPVTEAIVK